ncbi:MAG: CCA tRNA nucleotidyltransferase [Deltaproteobacteria bacterium]|nr:CCA tRNA nucleotidyltransferase [Deltaproteobacteria bacterium]
MSWGRGRLTRIIACQLYPGPGCPARSVPLPWTARSPAIDPSESPCHHAPVTAKELQARAIVHTLREHGFTAYLAGGCVRDKLLGVEPKDFDVATSARAADVQRLFAHTVPVGAQFGVVLVMCDGNPVEVATFRSDGLYLDGRHPVNVRFSDPREDAQRRDFTINGMFYDPVTEEVIDYIGGQQDLAAGIIRAIGDPYARFSEDRLRLLRAIRLAARLGFTIEKATFAAIQELAPTIVDIAWERIGDEVLKILTETCPEPSRRSGARRAFLLLSESGLLQAILPEIEAMRGVEQSPDFHPEGDVFVHTLLLLDKLDHPSETLALGALLHDVAKPLCRAQKGERITFYGHCEKGTEMAVAICQRLKRSRATWERVAYLVKNHLRLLSAPDMRIATLKRFLHEDGIKELLELARIDALSSSGDLCPYEFCRRKLAELGPEQIAPPRLLSGHDLIALGLPPGPRFKEILSAVEEAQLEGRLLTREEALAWVRQSRQDEG